MTETVQRRDWFWRVMAVALVLVLAQLAFRVAPGGSRFDLVRPLGAQGVAIAGSTICTAAPDGRRLYCWALVERAAGPHLRWMGSYTVPGS